MSKEEEVERLFKEYKEAHRKYVEYWRKWCEEYERFYMLREQANQLKKEIESDNENS